MSAASLLDTRLARFTLEFDAYHSMDKLTFGFKRKKFLAINDHIQSIEAATANNGG